MKEYLIQDGRRVLELYELATLLKAVPYLFFSRPAFISAENVAPVIRFYWYSIPLATTRTALKSELHFRFSLLSFL